MAHIADDVGQLLQIARSRKAPTREMESKLESHRAFIVAAFLEGLPIPTVQGSWRSIVLLKSVTRICARGFIASRSFEQPTSIAQLTSKMRSSRSRQTLAVEKRRCTTALAAISSTLSAFCRTWPMGKKNENCARRFPTSE